MVKAAVVLHESSLGVADKAPEIKPALSAAPGAFLREVEKLPRTAWENLQRHSGIITASGENIAGY
jgi:hypothetical protein